MPKTLRLALSLVLVAIAALALGASTAFAGPKEIAYVCHGEDICLLDPDNPSRGHQPDRQRDHQL